MRNQFLKKDIRIRKKKKLLRLRNNQKNVKT